MAYRSQLLVSANCGQVTPDAQTLYVSSAGRRAHVEGWTHRWVVERGDDITPGSGRFSPRRTQGQGNQWSGTEVGPARNRIREANHLTEHMVE